jgi:hypothetical protein
MKLGIMQPYFFPHLGYFDLINYSDQWIVFDKVKYIRHGWVNRNRIHHPHEGWQYVVVPLRKHGSNVDICDVTISDVIDWRSKILGQLQHYKKSAPYFRETIKVVEDCLRTDEVSLCRLNVSILEFLCALLGIHFRYHYFSQMNLDLDPITGPGDWALNISSAMGASTYVNPPGGRDLFDLSLFRKRGIDLEIREIPPMEYKCARYEYIPRLSIIDLLMWNTPAQISQYITQYKRLSGMARGQCH